MPTFVPTAAPTGNNNRLEGILNYAHSSDIPVSPSLSLSASPIASPILNHSTSPIASSSSQPVSAAGPTRSLLNNSISVISPQHPSPGSLLSATCPHVPRSSASDLPLAHPSHDVKPSEDATARPPLQVDEGESPQNTDSLENFIDVLSEELQLREKGENRRTDVLIYQGYELTRDRPGDRSRHNQYWHCCHKARQGCKSRLTLRVRDLENITKDAIIQNFVPHCHPPYRMKSYGTVEVSVLQSTDGSLGNATADGKSSHAISQLNEGDFEQDFNQENLTSKACSSPTIGNRRMLQHDPTQSLPGAHASVDITTLGLDTSQVDARGYPITRFIPCKRTYRDRSPIGQREEDDDSSDH